MTGGERGGAGGVQIKLFDRLQRPLSNGRSAGAPIPLGSTREVSHFGPGGTKRNWVGATSFSGGAREITAWTPDLPRLYL